VEPGCSRGECVMAADGLNHPDHEEAREPDEYRRIAASSLECRSQAVEILSWVWSSDAELADVRAAVAVANAWMKLAAMAAAER
jgi:hypothetical protein